MTTMDEVVSRRTRRAFRDALSGTPRYVVDELFQNEGLEPGPEPEGLQVWSASARLAARYLEVVDWKSQTEVDRTLQVFAQVLRRDEISPERRDDAARLLRGDGFEIDAMGRIRQASLAALPEGALADLADPEVIRLHLRRMNDGLERDPQHAVGAAKELLESTYKLVLRATGTKNKGNHFPALADAVESVLSSQLSTITPDAPGATALEGIIRGIQEAGKAVSTLRNRYGTGHGREESIDVPLWAARLAVGAATVCCTALLEILVALQAVVPEGADSVLPPQEVTPYSEPSLAEGP